MLNVSRIEEGRMVYSIGDVDINAVVKTVVHEYLEQAQQKSLKLTLETSDQAQYIVTVDPDRIYEVVSNLISNAVKYTDSGTISIKVHMLPHNAVRVDITDTGPGMTDAEQQKLFQKFYRAESNVGKQIGTGLGLYISKLLIEKFGGKIGVKSEKGKGSNFWFELPLKK
jgi:signal transduction histidine kinase